MLDLSLQQMLSRLVAILVITAVHGYMLALAARLLGDRGPQHDGRMSLNPFVHLDILAVASGVLFQLGWIRPMAIDSKALRGGWIGSVGVVVLALLGTLAVGALINWAQFLALRFIPQATSAAMVANVLAITWEMTLWFIVLNLLPIPPLAGGVVLNSLVPRAAELFERYGLIVRVALIGLMAIGALQMIVRPARDALAALLQF